MDDSRLRLGKLVERVLTKSGELPLALLLEQLVPIGRLRDLVRKFGLTPKGGFRIEKAPAKVLAPLLAEVTDAELLGEVVELLLPVPAAAAAKGDGDALVDARALLLVREKALQAAEIELQKARDGAARALERAAELQQRLDAAARESVVLRRDLEEARRAPKVVEAPPPADQKELQRQVRDLESTCEGFRAADAALRRQMAHNQSRLRELEEANTELEALLPTGKRRKKAPPTPPPEPERRFLLPRFLGSFYKSLDGKERRAVERAFTAVHLFCTEGHAYPGLEVKQLGGQDTWSLRASLGLRVYFRPLPDGEIEVLELADREEQHTTLRRLKDK
jgi:hypothetical protein